MENIKEAIEQMEVSKEQLYQDLKDIETLMTNEYNKLMELTKHYEDEEN